MVSKKDEKWRTVNATFAARSTDNDWKKRVGESAAVIWLDQKRFNYFAVNANIDDMPESLKAMGGKRPDFCADVQGELLYLDAKYHYCPNDEFYLEDAEISKYVKLRDWLVEQGDDGERNVAFMVFPHKYSATKLFFVHLDELIQGQAFITGQGNPAKKVSLLNRPELTFSVGLILEE